MNTDRRSLLVGAGAGAALAALPGAVRATVAARNFPKGFLWGAATAGPSGARVSGPR